MANGSTFPQIRDFLNKCNLLEYYDKFIEEGFDQLQSLLDVTEADLIAMGAKRGHRRRLQREIATLKGIPPNVPFYIQHGHETLNSPIYTNNIMPSVSQDVSNTHYASSSSSSSSYSANVSASTEQQQNVISSNDSQNDSSLGTSNQKRKYKRHPKRDQNAPSKPHSAYVLFAQKVRSEYKVKEMNLTFPEMAKVVGDRWKKISTHEKEELEAQASAEKEKYLVSLSKYKTTEHWKKYQEYLKEFKEKYESSARDSKARKRQKIANSPDSDNAIQSESSSNRSSGGYHADSGSGEMSSGSSNYNNNEGRSHYHASRHSSTSSNYIPPYRHLNPPLPFFNASNNNNTKSTAPLHAEDERTIVDDSSSKREKKSACENSTNGGRESSIFSSESK
ncbi:hypothetical protein Glove_415g25 [Diversispora epigaea]|uniref:HMG box domain-containing protein n=1 Tax=Diversispora epigaea TaxID=1348612 RepID=A0A397H158_9GLOM|nr:hypothetical protein Glove_415g25 [Diversispora epigaea]